MIPTLNSRWTRKELALILMIVTFICAVIFLSVSLARPKPYPSAKLGADWQCSTSLFMTSCTPAPQTEIVLHHPHKGAMCLRQA
jgi:uncharacterized SAM-binding protein YcdF (DUF218 family)